MNQSTVTIKKLRHYRLRTWITNLKRAFQINVTRLASLSQEAYPYMFFSTSKSQYITKQGNFVNRKKQGLLNTNHSLLSIIDTYIIVPSI